MKGEAFSESEISTAESWTKFTDNFQKFFETLKGSYGHWKKFYKREI